MKLPKPPNKVTRCTRLGLMLACLTPLLTGCGLMPALKSVYIAVPSTGNLALLCDPIVPLPPRKPATGRQLEDYMILLQDEIKECAAQQEEYRSELARMINKAKSRMK